jgi:hypothetical protein
MRNPKIRQSRFTVLAVALAAALAFSGCIWDFQEGCDGDYGGCQCPECYDDDGDPPDPQDTDEEETESYWDEHECDEQDPADPCQEAICEGIDSYQDALDGCVEVQAECDCAFIEGCLVAYVECIGASCVDQYEHDVGAMIDCSLAFAVCIDPCE